MKTTLFTIIILLTASIGYTQTLKPDFNFDFEHVKNGKALGWEQFGDSGYQMSLDSTTVKSGKYSVTISFTGENMNFRAWSITIPNSYSGKKITLKGFIKTENVTKGYAGLWMRIDPSVAFDNMNQRGVKGTTDWKEYSITLKMNPEKTKQIVVGGLLSGNGKMWIDDLKISIDGKNIEDLKPLSKKEYPADKDHQFDKGSGISSIMLSKLKIENLKNLCLIWGFLKYYHPQIANGNYNWDYELFSIMPKVLTAENSTQLNEVFVLWIKKLGEVNEGKTTQIKEADIKFRPDLDWIKNSGFSNDLQDLLLQVKDAKKLSSHYYVSLTGVGNAEFKNENSYTAMKYPDAGFRLLSLFRYWNVIQYYFPYKNLIEQDWKQQLETFIPKMVNAKDETAYVLTTLELIGQIHDTHANIWGQNEVLNKYFGINYAPVELTFIEDKPVITGYFNQDLGMASGLEIGDIISKIDNKSIDEILKNRLKYTPASNRPTQLRDIARDLLRSNDSVIQVTIIRNGKEETNTVKTYSTKELNIYKKYENPDKAFKLLSGNIAYIHNGALKKADLPKIWKEMKNTKGLIIDNRNYPSDFPLYALMEYLMPKRTKFVTLTQGSLVTPGLFSFRSSLSVGKMKNKNYYKGKVVILTNEISQSASEFNAMAYRVQPNSIVVGSTTAGADGNVSQFYLPGGLSTMISGIGVFYPDRTETQRIGIVPDIEIKPSIEGVKNGMDELLNKAIEVINMN
jgi:C-terminal processing protease CtpA/Prc